MAKTITAAGVKNYRPGEGGERSPTAAVLVSTLLFKPVVTGRGRCAFGDRTASRPSSRSVRSICLARRPRANRYWTRRLRWLRREGLLPRSTASALWAATWWPTTTPPGAAGSPNTRVAPRARTPPPRKTSSSNTPARRPGDGARLRDCLALPIRQLEGSRPGSRVACASAGTISLSPRSTATTSTA